jgi:hypothetical protein
MEIENTKNTQKPVQKSHFSIFDHFCSISRKPSKSPISKIIDHLINFTNLMNFMNQKNRGVLAEESSYKKIQS